MQAGGQAQQQGKGVSDTLGTATIIWAEHARYVSLNGKVCVCVAYLLPFNVTYGHNDQHH